MRMLFIGIGALVAAELAMLSGELPKTFKLRAMIPAPPAVDGKWARAMVRKAERETRQAALSSSHRQALNACLGPDRESFSPSRYEAKAKACEAQMVDAAAETDEPTPFDYPKPAPQPEPAQAEAPAQVPPAG